MDIGPGATPEQGVARVGGTAGARILIHTPPLPSLEIIFPTSEEVRDACWKQQAFFNLVFFPINFRRRERAPILSGKFDEQ